MSLFLIIFGALGIIWSILPIIIYGMIGLGNLTSLGVFTAFLLTGLFWKKLMGFKKQIQKKKSGRILVNSIRVFLGAFLLLVLYLTILMISGMNIKPQEDATVVVLGCQVRSYGPALTLRERLNKAYDYLNEHPDAKCILSGGQGANEPMTESSAMYEYLVDKGIDPNRLYMEDKSTNTEENIKYTMELIEKEGLNENITLISSEYHLYRATVLAKRQGINPGTVSAHTSWIMFLTYYVRELYGILAQGVLGM